MVWRRERSASRTRRSGGPPASPPSSVVLDVAGAERGVDERGKRLDIGAHHDDVAGLEGRVVAKGVEDGISDDLDLAGQAMAGVNLQAAVVRVELGAAVRPAREGEARRQAIVADVGLEPLQQGQGGGRLVVPGMVVILQGRRGDAGQDQLHLATVVGPRRQQRVAGQPGGVVGGPAHRRRPAPGHLGHPHPLVGCGVEQEQVHVAAGRDGAQHLEITGGEAGQAEQRHPGGQGKLRRIRPKALAGGAQALGGAGLVDAVPQTPPQLGLPGDVGGYGTRGTGGPGAQHLGAVDAVAVVQVGDVADGGESPAAGVAGIQVGRQRGQPRLAQQLVDHVQQGPNGPLRKPGVAIAVDTGSGRHGVAHQPGGKREVDIGAHPVTAPGRHPEASREPLRQPPLDAAGGHGDHLGRHRVVERLENQVPQRLDEPVRPLCSMKVQHAPVSSGSSVSSSPVRV